MEWRRLDGRDFIGGRWGGLGSGGWAATEDYTGNDDYLAIGHSIRLASGMDLPSGAFQAPVVFQAKNYIVKRTILLSKYGESGSY